MSESCGAAPARIREKNVFSLVDESIRAGNELSAKMGREVMVHATTLQIIEQARHERAQGRVPMWREMGEYRNTAKGIQLVPILASQRTRED